MHGRESHHCPVRKRSHFLFKVAGVPSYIPHQFLLYVDDVVMIIVVMMMMVVVVVVVV